MSDEKRGFYCVTCSNVKVVPTLDDKGSSAKECPECGHLSWAETLALLCLWHEEKKDGAEDGYSGDPEWAKGHLERHIQYGTITAEQAADIREYVGWTEPRDWKQKSLF